MLLSYRYAAQHACQLIEDSRLAFAACNVTVYVYEKYVHTSREIHTRASSMLGTLSAL